MNEEDIRKLADSCTRFLTGHHRQRLTPHQALVDLAEAAGAELKSDLYGKGDVITNFEADVARLLGKPAAVFMPSGTMCQQIALRIWADRRGTRHVAFHPTCHLEQDEEKGYQLLHGLHGILVGTPDQLMTLADLQKVSEPLAALLIELPQRRIGGQLPSWADLNALIDWARERGVPTHLDGARLWECQPFYQREYADIAALFDTVYVSFYKGLGGLAGSILAGPADLIAEARIWQRRHGGNLIRLFPYVLSAQKGMAERLGRMQAYHEKAVAIAAALATLPAIEIVPQPPHTNMLHLFMRGERARLESAALDLARETGVWLFQNLFPSPLPRYSKFELTVGDATLDLDTQEVAGLFRSLLDRAEAAQPRD